MKPPLLRWIVTAAACALAAGSSPTPARALDFQLHTTRIEEDGFTRELTYFQGDEKTRIIISLPARWAATGESNALTLMSPGGTGNTVRLERSAFTPDLAFKDKGLETYRQKAFSLIPPGATGAKLVEEHEDPLPIMHWQSHEFVVAYDFYGQALRRSVLFLNLNAKEQLVLTAVATQADFDAVRTVGLDVLRSWQPQRVQ